MDGHGTSHQALSVKENKCTEMLSAMWEWVTRERSRFSVSCSFFAALWYCIRPDEEKVTQVFQQYRLALHR